MVYRDNLNTANQKIATMVSYGVKPVTATDDCYQISWSNGSASWYLSSNRIEKGTVVKCDANQVLISMRRRDIEQAILAQALKPLPLYNDSFEVVHGGRKPL